jgi:protein-export membrane protein SecD
MLKHRYISIFLIALMVLVGYFVYSTQINPQSKYAFKLGLDLAGGTELIYNADISQARGGDIGSAMSTLRDVIERRVNIFGVSEPVVETQTAGLLSGSQDYRLVVDLPGVTDVSQAESMIGETPHLEFELVRPEAKNLTADQLKTMTVDQIYMPTGLDGSLLDNASLQFSAGGTGGGIAGEPTVAIEFNSVGRDLFAKLTTENKGQVLAVVLDGVPISTPTINDAITDGKAVISGSFTADQAKTLVRNLNYGALPIPITLQSTQSIGPSLGQNAKDQGVKAGAIGFALIALFLILWYRLPGLIASISLVMYVALSLAVFKLIPVTLTAAGIAGFILSIGMAVDANVLIFERLKEELKKGSTIHDAMALGFSRAWLSIRDSNISSIITAIVLFWLGTSAVKGFALTLGLGVLISMFTAISVSRTFLFAVSPANDSKVKRFLFSNGFHK